ncbi:hypothetical protein E2320_006688, partial [Naja naja]
MSLLVLGPDHDKIPSSAHSFFLFLLFQYVTCPTTSFTDLAEIVSRIEPVKAMIVD